MAIEFSLKLEKRMLDEKVLTLFGEMPYNKLGFEPSLLDMNDPYYSKYETIFLADYFEYEQFLFFEFDKSADLTASYENAVKIALDLMCKINTRALLTTSMFTELCFFDNSKWARELFINTSQEIWGKIDVKEQLSKWNVVRREMDGKNG